MIGWAIDTIVATSVLMLVVLAIRGPVSKVFGPHIAYALWLLPAFRMILPPLPETVAPQALHMLPSPINLELLLMAPIPSAAAEGPSVDWGLLGLLAWSLGSLGFLGWHLISYRRFVNRAMDEAVQLPRMDRDGVEVCASPAASGPFAAGIFLKTIVLPEDYRRRYAGDELRLAIEHEVQHHRRCDMSANFAALVVLALHWWNPIAYFAHRAFRADQELACDALVLARATLDERHAYGSALIKSACDHLPVAACALGAGDDLKRRLKMMKSHRVDPARARLGGVITAGLVGGGLLLTASGGIAAETSRQVEEQVRTVLAPVVPALTPDAPPAPPATPASVVPASVSDAPAKLALLMHPHPTPPAPPALPVVPVPPVPPIIVDGDEIAREVRQATEEARREAAEARREALQEAAEARQEALQEAAEARREALQDAAEARRDAEEARREVARDRAHAITVRTHAEAARTAAHTRAAAKACNNSRAVMVQTSHDEGRTSVRCLGWSDKDKAEFRRTMIASLQSARASIASMDVRHMPGHAREQALQSIDRQLERLRSEK